MEGDCNVYALSSLWMHPTRPDRYNAKMVYMNMILPLKIVMYIKYIDEDEKSG